MSHQLCQMCHKNPATVHEYIVAEKKENHLCEECYRKLYQKEVTPVIKLEILQKLLFPGAGQEKPAKKKKELVCPSCGMRLGEFKRLGRFGCAECYQAFAKVLDPILESIHDACRHVSSSEPPPSGEGLTTPGTFRMRKEKLQKALQEAVREERYEEAARIRDELKALEEQEEGGPSKAEGGRP